KPGDIERMANRHGIVPPFPEPWKKNLTAGSDDHSSLNLTRTYTEVKNAETLEDFWTGIDQGRAKICSRSAQPPLLARSIYGIAYQFYKSKANLERYVRKDLFLCFLERSLRTRPDNVEPRLAWYYGLVNRLRKSAEDLNDGSISLISLARAEAEKLIKDDPQLMEIVREGSRHGGEMDTKWFEFVNQLSNKMLVEFGRRLVNRVSGGQIFDLFSSLGNAGALYALLAPYFVSFSLFSKQRRWSEEVLGHFAEGGASPENRSSSLALFTDTFRERNGVAAALRRNLAAALGQGKDLTILSIFPAAEPTVERGVHAFNPVGVLALPDQPDLKLPCPPFLQLLEHCYEQNFTLLHAATPGPMGLAALGIARVLRLPISGSCDSALPRFANLRTDDGLVEEILWKYLTWFYQQLDWVYVPSRAMAAQLVEKGLSAGKVRVYPRGVDGERFHPDLADPAIRHRYGLNENETVLLYAGRLSPEKNLHVLAEAYRKMISEGDRARLVLAGEGPTRKELEKGLAGTPAVFTGFLEEEDLAALMASSDVLVQPSATETFGSVVLEAQACGLSVIVTNAGGPRENMLPGQTGLVVEAGSVDDLHEAMESLAHDPNRRYAMGRAARQYAEHCDQPTAFSKLWEMQTGDEARSHQSTRFESLASIAPEMAAMNF
ncbi:glycosyltransferase family 1 protein, partial [bacterium]|nr:glycosyltransferase family 1 protein [bacterium]